MLSKTSLSLSLSLSLLTEMNIALRNECGRAAVPAPRGRPLFEVPTLQRAAMRVEHEDLLFSAQRCKEVNKIISKAF